MEQVIQRFKETQRFVVTSHQNPDGDNVGSCVALVRFLNRMGKQAVHYLNDEIPSNLNFLLEDHSVYEDTAEVLAQVGDSYDLIVLDCAEGGRPAIDPIVREKAACVINIDHHISNTGFGDINYIRSDISSTCEVVTGLMRAMDETLVDAAVATAAYTGISTDTGNFLFPSVKPDTFRNAAFLTERGADRTRIANELYRSTSIEQRVLTKLLLETFTVEDEVGIMTMTQEMLAQSGVAYKDTEIVTNLGVDTKGVEIGILIKETAPEQYKISLRSKGTANVCVIAEQFGGGGHRNASGCTMQGTIPEVRARLQQAAAAQLKKDRAHA